ncbi:MAG: hypothetical protein COV52_09030 [Gammaproteobacteria bacterium CG11_big_fil_rev_8_21_14_0_20_46_22]|nr:MAG: hypothetical protein COW05_01645 [Gammaproteobacteria bacterium CG12_big_fil_rev_8_21_14_0_65_46_12]PIR10420.1 MAG: hypothetical protein COV52_09030 [Gammaproteobacteria bacterium CG11_big_fil_rev_8_21_14_0_20_46_22]
MAELSFDNNTLSLKGDITFQTATACYESGLAHFQKGRALVVDFSGIEKVDSSALAVLLAWLKEAKIREVALSYRALPASLKQLAALCELTMVFNTLYT